MWHPRGSVNVSFLQENALKGGKPLEQPEADRKHRYVVVMPLLEDNTEKASRKVNLGDTGMVPAAGLGLWTGLSHAFLQERCSENGSSLSGWSVERQNCPLTLGLCFTPLGSLLSSQVAEVPRVDTGRRAEVRDLVTPEVPSSHYVLWL